MAPEGFAGIAGGEVEAEAEGVELVVGRLGPGKPAA